MRTLRPAIRAHRSKILPRSRTRVWRQEKQEPKTRPAISRLCMALIGLCALTQPDRHPQPTAPSRTSAKGFARPLFEGLSNFALCSKDGRMHCFEKRSVIMSHLKYEIERIRHDPHDELLKTSPFCSEPAAAVSITCQETPKRTASPFHETCLPHK